MLERDQVIKSLNHKQPTQVPVEFGATAVTGIHITCVAALRKYYGLEEIPVKLHEPYQMLGYLDEDLKQALDIDIEGIIGPDTFFGFRNENWKEWQLDSGLVVLISEHMKTSRDPNGDLLIYPKGDTTAPPSGRMPKGGFYFDTIVRQEPLDENKLDPQDNLEEFVPISDADLEYYKNEVKRVKATKRATIATFGGTAFGDISLVPAAFLKYPKGIRDIEEWYVSTVTRKDYIHKVFEKQAEIALHNLEKLHQIVMDSIDAVFICGTDFGTQQSLFCSPAAFRELYMPYYKIVNNWIHKNTSWKTFKHCCGAIEPLIPELVESGFDILNPVQCSAKGMDPKLLKSKYGQKVVFWGGGVDTQFTLPFGTPDQVREQVLERCEIFAQDGGFIFNTVHNVQANTPVENLVAMFDAVKEFNGK